MPKAGETLAPYVGLRPEAALRGWKRTEFSNPKRRYAYRRFKSASGK